MKPNPHRTLGARLLMSAVLNCCTAVLAEAPNHDVAPQRSGQIEQTGRREQAASTPSAHFVPEQASALNSMEPSFVRARAFLFLLLQEGYDSRLLDSWLEALGEDTIIEGMPGDLIVAFFGEPLNRRSIAFEGARAEQWSIVRRPNQEEQLIVFRGKVVHIGL